MKDLFLLKSDVAFLNHGSFGACPRPVFEAYQRYQRELETQPVAFLQREYASRMQGARQSLAGFLRTDADNLVFTSNVTVSLNVVARSLRLRPGDEIITTNHEYGATHRMWEAVCARTGADLTTVPLPHRAGSPDQLADQLTEALSDRTRVMFISHLTSTTAMCFPVQRVIADCRERGVLCIVDGAHAPGQIDLDLDELDADVYVGNCHKWLMAPKGAGFLCVRPAFHEAIEPLIVSWGQQSHSTTGFVREMEYQGTQDIAPFLAVTDAIRFQREHDWRSVRNRCSQLCEEAEREINGLTGLSSLYGSPGLRCPQMVTMELPADIDIERVKNRLYDEFLVEVPVLRLEGKSYVRASLQGYNDARDVDRFRTGMAAILEGSCV